MARVTNHHRATAESVPLSRTLTIAGSDSGGGAGIQADLKTFTAFGTYGMSVITAVTAQNTVGVQGAYPLTADQVVAQLESVLTDIGADGVKTGMLVDAEIVTAVAETLAKFASRSDHRRSEGRRGSGPGTGLETGPRTAPENEPQTERPTGRDTERTTGSAAPRVAGRGTGREAARVTGREAPRLTGRETKSIPDARPDPSALRLVVDPVMIAKSGDALLERAAVTALQQQLLPLATVVTPNIPEAEVLTGHKVRDRDDMVEAGRRLLEFGVDAALVTGGHLPGQQSDDVLITRDDVIWYPGTKIDTRHTHGTGCTLSAALTAALAKGTPLPDAVAIAKRFIHDAIAAAPALGQGHGPTNHLVWLRGSDKGAGDGAHEGTGDGAHEGAGDGAHEGTGDGAHEGAGDGAHEGAGDGAHEGTGGSADGEAGGSVRRSM